LNLKGRDIDFIFKRSSRARNLRIQVSLGSEVEVIAPNRVTELTIFQFIQEKQNWILNKLAHFDKFGDFRKENDEVYYLGQIYKISNIPGTSNSVHFDGESFNLNYHVNSKPKHVLEDWFRNEARINIKSMVKELAEEYKLEYNRISIKEQKTRWGSCSKQGNLNFNFKLMMAPEAVIRYVIIHELTHLTHMNHSRNFWRLLAERCPEYQTHIRWLKRHGSFLKL